MATRSTVLLAALGGSFVLAAAAVAADASARSQPVHVEFQHPERFTDAADRNPADERVRAFHLDRLARYLTERATPLLRAGQRLDIVITEVDRAGPYEPWRRRLDDVRIVRNVYPVRIDLRFRLADGNGMVLKEGERELRDSFFLDRWRPPQDPLRYEKALLDAWLERELGERPA